VKADRTARWRAGLRQHIRRLLIVVLVVAGALCGLTAVLFDKMLEGAHAHLIGAALRQSGMLRPLAVIGLPTVVGALLALLVPRIAPGAGGGLALVRRGYADDPSRLDARTWFGTLLATTLSLGAGVPLGPEGPAVVLTSTVCAGFARVLGLPQRVVRGMIPVGAAAGIAAIFNTPITGVVFALEEVIGTASRGVLGGAIVAAVAAAVVQNQALGGQHLLPAGPAAWRSAPELFGFAMLGVMGGVTAGLLPRLVRRLRVVFARLGQGPRADLSRGGIAGFAVGILGLMSPPILGIGYPVIANWLAGGGDAQSAAIAFVVKFFGMGVALAARLVGGVFAPSLFLGASLGAAMGHLTNMLVPHSGIDAGAYALVGMGAFFAGFLRTPIASVLIVFELTGDYGLVAPLMLAVAISSLVARRISPNTLVEQQLEEQGISTEEANSDPLAQSRVLEAMSSPAFSLPASMRLREAWDVVAHSPHRSIPVVDEGGLCVGIITRDALHEAAEEGPELPLKERMAQLSVVATPDEQLVKVSLRLATAGETRCPVVESLAQRRLVGFLTAADLLRARLRATVEDEREGEFDPLGR
jgi:chloride channel protein, CIC family